MRLACDEALAVHLRNAYSAMCGLFSLLFVQRLRPIPSSPCKAGSGWLFALVALRSCFS